MLHPFLGSPALCYLMAMTFHLVYIIILSTCETDVFATACGLVVCFVMVCISLLCYAFSLHWNEIFSQLRSYLGVGLAVAISLLAAALLVCERGEWNTWAFLAWVSTIALGGIFVVDFLIFGLLVFRLSVWRFMERIHR